MSLFRRQSFAAIRIHSQDAVDQARMETSAANVSRQPTAVRRPPAALDSDFGQVRAKPPFSTRKLNNCWSRRQPGERVGPAGEIHAQHTNSRRACFIEGQQCSALAVAPHPRARATRNRQERGHVDGTQTRHGDRASCCAETWEIARTQPNIKRSRPPEMPTFENPSSARRTREIQTRCEY